MSQLRAHAVSATGNALDSYRLDEVDFISATVGRILLLWGIVEDRLNGLTLVLIHPLNSPPKNKGVPPQFSAKLELLARCYRENSRMASIADEANGLLERLKPLHERRNIIVHGHYQGVGPNNHHVFTIYRAGRAERHGWRWEYFTASDLDGLATEIMSIEREVESLVKRTHRLSAQQSD